MPPLKFGHGWVLHASFLWIWLLIHARLSMLVRLISVRKRDPVYHRGQSQVDHTRACHGAGAGHGANVIYMGLWLFNNITSYGINIDYTSTPRQMSIILDLYPSVQVFLHYGKDHPGASCSRRYRFKKLGSHRNRTSIHQAVIRLTAKSREVSKPQDWTL